MDPRTRTRWPSWYPTTPTPPRDVPRAPCDVAASEALRVALADERRRTERDIAAHMRRTDGDWGSVIDDIERSNYQRTTDRRGSDLPDPA